MLSNVEDGAARSFGGVGRGTFRFLGEAGRFAIFCLATVVRLFSRRFRALEVVAQIDLVGAGSMGVVMLPAVFTGLVLALQGYYALVRFGSENLVGSLVALSLTRELAPVLTALMVTARAGSAMTATIGNMAVTEQIDALKSLAVDPLQLPGAAAPAGVGGGAAAARRRCSRLRASRPRTCSASTCWGWTGSPSCRTSARRSSGRTCRLVSARRWSSASLIAWIATFRGVQTSGGALGVGRATSRTVVETAVLILCGDYVMTALLF